MLSEKEIEALKKGAYGINRQGQRVRIVSTNHKPPYSILCLVEVNGHDEYQPLRSNFTLYENEDSGLDIVGLWEEPFNLEHALAGEPLINVETKEKCYLLSKSKFAKVDVYYVEEQASIQCWNETDLNVNYVMWKEPEPTKSEYKELPKPTSIHINKTDEYQVKLRFGSDEDYNIWAKHIRKHADKLFYKV
ncbi:MULTISPECIES: hypothetical protein [Rodentibacter]|uniref:Uncharacterized protein n=1 Tax=Rodentibacter genomosp. 2 TaxID=1908266 RepID=A0A1V3JPE6_9PAST|nr:MULTISPECIES: hypothetical protein [Pasteurellaceae]MCR1837598.1 hypothetical protein [Pasteurella caecimuris]MCU0107984.1 hypothetical protein [Pasteurella caecimuris]OOF58287.1 hypothetical protein BKK55_02640 [Rodentibacter genomosp. 2]